MSELVCLPSLFLAKIPPRLAPVFSISLKCHLELLIVSSQQAAALHFQYGTPSISVQCISSVVWNLSLFIYFLVCTEEAKCCYVSKVCDMSAWLCDLLPHNITCISIG